MTPYNLDDIVYLANEIRKSILSTLGTIKGRSVNGFSDAGDAQFNVDYIAEETAKKIVHERFTDCILYTEDYKDSHVWNKNYLLLIDPIDGTRPAAAGIEMATISIALSDFKNDVCINDVKQALVMEIKSGAWIYADNKNDNVVMHGYNINTPNLNKDANLKNMFWTFEFNGHPTEIIINKIGHIIDHTANTGGVFIFNSATYSILKIITGQMDAYVDIGNRVLKDNPDLIHDFCKVGNGKVLHLFPYDIAAISFIGQKAKIFITDAYGNSLDTTRLLDFGWKNQQSCIAASTRSLHNELINIIKW